jgi:AcrR family transcriptional regulator
MPEKMPDNSVAAKAEELPLRERKRQYRRAALIDAAREVFYETHYVAATVEDIIQRADISRPTFYRYFSDKDSVLREILLEDVAAQAAMWQKLSDIGAPTDQQLLEWSQRFVKAMRKHSRTVALFNVATGMDTALIHEFSRGRDRYLAILGAGIEAFKLKGDGSPRDAERRAGAHLLFYQIDQISVNFAFPGSDLDEGAMLGAFVRNFRYFLDTLSRTPQAIERRHRIAQNVTRCYVSFQ